MNEFRTHFDADFAFKVLVKLCPPKDRAHGIRYPNTAPRCICRAIKEKFYTEALQAPQELRQRSLVGPVIQNPNAAQLLRGPWLCP